MIAFHTCPEQQLAMDRIRDVCTLSCTHHLTYSVPAALALMRWDTNQASFIFPLGDSHIAHADEPLLLPFSLPRILALFNPRNEVKPYKVLCYAEKDAPPLDVARLRYHLWQHFASMEERLLGDLISHLPLHKMHTDTGSHRTPCSAYGWSAAACWPCTGSTSLPWWEPTDPSPAALLAAGGDWIQAKMQCPRIPQRPE